MNKKVVRYKAKGYDDDPFFIKKAEASKKVIERYGLPKEWITRKK